MTLGTKQEHDVLDWLEQHGVRRDCVACGHEGRAVGDIIASPSTPHGGGTALRGPSFPLVQVFCEKCGYVMHFNSSRIGLPV